MKIHLLTAAVASAILALSACTADEKTNVGLRTDALDDSLWAESEWISAAEVFGTNCNDWKAGDHIVRVTL